MVPAIELARARADLAPAAGEALLQTKAKGELGRCATQRKAPRPARPKEMGRRV